MTRPADGVVDRPVIGITTYRQRARSGVWDVDACFLPAQYLDAVTRAGAIGVLLPPQPVDAAGAGDVLDRLDALSISGGSDVDPARYGQPAHERTDTPQPARDEWELALLASAIERRVPVLGICRGAQVLNVACGGSLHQHVPDVVPGTAHRGADAVFTANDVRTVPGSKIAAIVGQSLPGQCYHHQAIDRLGEGLVVSATDRLGVIEAVEMPGHPFLVAVQWHPEESLDDPRLFAALVDAARAAKQAA